ncbi:MAG: hypothetical protein HWD61_05175 [Parachlamydiaceae bacterium]|nr:MAG: hypothetical protein HWD61_05175 [Parachlamydiaceae bacterium]
MKISDFRLSAHLFSIDIDYKLQDYYVNFDTWTEEQQWEKIIQEGQKILEEIQNVRPHDEARICSHLPSSYFFQGHFSQALIYAERCSRTAETIKNTELFLKGLYLQSASYRGLAGKQKEWLQEEFYKKAVELCEKALMIYTEKKQLAKAYWQKFILI